MRLQISLSIVLQRSSTESETQLDVAEPTADAPEERVITIRAETVEAAMNAKKLVKNVVFNPGVSHSFTIPVSARGGVLGKAGFHIRSFRNVSATNISLKEATAEAPDECVVTVQGTTQQAVDLSTSLVDLVVKALQTVKALQNANACPYHDRRDTAVPSGTVDLVMLSEQTQMTDESDK
jgi:hypothetical protein